MYHVTIKVLEPLIIKKVERTGLVKSQIDRQKVGLGPPACLRVCLPACIACLPFPKPQSHTALIDSNML